MINGTVFILLGVGLAGYVYLTRVYDYKYKVPRYQGHHLLFRALTTGALFYLASGAAFLGTWWLTSKHSLIIGLFEVIYPDVSQKLFNQIVIIVFAILLAFWISRLRNGILIRPLLRFKPPPFRRVALS